MDPHKLDEARKRALIISSRVRSRIDEAIRGKILAFPGELQWEPEQYGIDRTAWQYVKEIGVKHRLVFAHPDLLKAHPDASLYYRGIATLSLKRVHQIAGSVDTWEKNPGRARVTAERALRVACLYNSIISSIIRDSTNWTLDNGHRNVLATIGITEDGSIRNIIGQEAERTVKERIVKWLESQHHLICEADETRTTWQLGTDGDLQMIFSSEPDISFERRTGRNWETVATIEVKGGTDPAGALERLGAVKKSFDQTPARTKNFLIVGVVTDEMEKQLNQMQIERYFSLSETLYLDSGWEEFVNEVFYHTLRFLNAPFKTV